MIYYSITNGGDGSAYPEFMESEELAEWDQDHQSEPWGEPCTGSIEIESDSPITVKDLTTKESYYINNYCDSWGDRTKERAEYVKKFFLQDCLIFQSLSKKTQRIRSTAGIL